MFKNQDSNKIKFLTTYLYLIIAFVGSCGVLFIFKSNLEIVNRAVVNLNLLNVEIFFDLIIVIVLFLIFNTSYYSLVSHRRYRMMVFSITFLSTGVFELLYIVNKFNLISTQSSFFQIEFRYSVFTRLILGIGLLIASLIPVEKKIESINNMVQNVIPLVGLFIFLFFNKMLGTYINHAIEYFNYRFIHMFAEYFIVIILLGVIIIYLDNYKKTESNYIIQLCSGVVFVLFGQVLRVVYGGSLNELNYVMFSVYQAIGVLIVFIAIFRHNIGIPIVQLMNAEKQIKLYAENLEKIIEKRTNEIRNVNARFIKEMEYAREIQQSLLPLKRLNFRNTIFVSEFFPCERLSGDFYDIYVIDDDNIGMYVLDVSGHGVSAALMTMFCNNYIKSSERLIKRYRGLKPHRNLRHFYEEFNKMNFPEEMHMVVFFACYNLETKVLTYSSGGMNCYPILVRKNGEMEYLDKSQGFPICKFSQFYTPEYTSANIDLTQGDRVIFYTDGLIDNNKNTVLDEDELIRILKENSNEPIKVLNNKIVAKLTPVAGKLEDDVTYFIMEIT